MKNVRDNQLKRCIIMKTEEFKKVFTSIFGKYDADTNQIDVEFNGCEGIYFCGISDTEVYKKMSEYFDVIVTSIHLDDCEYDIGVWIVYKEKEETTILDQLWRYSVNSGEYGGLVLADSEESAEHKVVERYKKDDIVVWKITNDEYFDSDYVDVLECYGN